MIFTLECQVTFLSIYLIHYLIHLTNTSQTVTLLTGSLFRYLYVYQHAVIDRSRVMSRSYFLQLDVFVHLSNVPICIKNQCMKTREKNNIQ